MSSVLELASQASWYCTPTRFVLIVGARTANKNIFFRYPLLQTQVYDGLMNLYVRHGIYLQLQTKLRMYSWKYYFLSLVAANVILHLHFLEILLLLICLMQMSFLMDTHYIICQRNT